MKRINLFFITIASMFVFSIQAMKLNQPDQFSDLNVLVECCCTSSKFKLLKTKLLHGNGPVFKRSGRGTRRQRIYTTIKPKSRRLSEYTPVNIEFCREDDGLSYLRVLSREDGLSYLQLLTKANAKKDQDVANKKRWEELRRVAPKMMSIMRDIGNDDVARYIRGELIEAQYKEMSQFDLAKKQ